MSNGTGSEDLSGNIKRCINGLAVEVGRRVASTQGEVCGEMAEIETRQVLLDWFLGDFFPRATADEANEASKSAPVPPTE